MRLTLPHVYDFGSDRELVGSDLVRPAAWDALRTRTTGPFALASDREAWHSSVTADSQLRARAEAIDRWLDAAGASSVASYGAGTGALELLLHRLAPGRPLIATDFGPETVARLTSLFPEAEVRQHDLLLDPPLAADVHLLHRIDTEFTNDQWRHLLRQFSGQRLLVVATAVLSPFDALLQTLNRIRHRGLTRAGWARNGAAFESLWGETHVAQRLQMHDLVAWDLQPRQ